MTNDRIGNIIASLTLEEKASLASGKSFWETQDIPAKGVPSIWLADGPHGLRKEDRLHIRENGGHSVKATCFPTASALACAWSPALARRVGAAIGRECRAHGVAVVLGPGVNIKRSPLCGRNFEYYSEDPLLAGKLAAGFIRGAEGEGVGTSLKHFAVNNQETLRMSVSAEVDERALHELYLRPFEIAVKEGAPSTVMCSYNRINGVYASENRMLLTRILREQWGFDGLVISDWGAVYRRPAGVAAGLDLEMPSSGGVTDREIVRAVRAGRLDEAALDALCARVLRLALAHAPQRKKAYPAPVHNVAAVRRMLDRHHALAVRAARESAVLLKNEGRVLPLAPDAKVAVFGILSDTDKTLSFLFAIMMWQCIDQLCRKALTDYGGKLPTPVHFIFDEFANIGTIPQIEETIAVTRSRNIGITIILQSMSQLESKYDKKAQTIVDCCDSTLFLGGKSNSTNKEIAEMIGKQTIHQMTYNESTGQSSSAGKNLQIQGRDLIDAAEIGKMSRRKAILLIAGTNPLMDDKFDPHTHKRYCYIVDKRNPKRLHDKPFDFKRYLEGGCEPYDDHDDSATGEKR